MRRILAVLGALLTVQAALVVVWVLVERARHPVVPFTAEVLDEPAPTLSWERPDARGELPADAVVHFWATWCAPCRDELPHLLDAAEAHDVTLLAVTDEPWPVVERFFAGRVPPAVVRDPTGEATRRWAVSGLPQTYAVRGGRVIGRVVGRRDWTTADALQWLIGEERVPIDRR